MRIKRLLLYFAFITIFPFSVIWSQNSESKNHRDMYFINQLNLNEEQKKDFKDLFFDHEEKMLELQTELKRNRLDFRKLMSNEGVSEKEIYNLASKGSEIREKIINSKISFWLNVNKLLNEEQRDIWKRNLEKIIFQNDNNFEKRRDMRKELGRERFQKEGSRQRNLDKLD